MVELPVLRHSIILVTCLDLEFLTGRDYSSIHLRHANAAIRQVMLGIESSTSAESSCRRTSTGSVSVSPDEILFAIMSLAKQSPSTSFEPLPGTFGLFDPLFPLGLQFLNLWGQEATNHMHCKAMQHIIRSRNGLANAGISTPGFAETLYQFDLLESAKTLTEPFMEVPRCRSEFLKEQVVPLRMRHLLGEERHLNDGFDQALPQLSDYDELSEIFCQIRLFCTWIQTAHDLMLAESMVKDPCPQLMSDLAMLRDVIEHRLLAYKSVDSSAEEQLCWTAGLIFTHCVIYPLPNRKPLEILLDRLVDLLREDDGADRELMVWAAMIGAMACHTANGRRRQFFLGRLVKHLGLMEITSWSRLRNLLRGFLWLDRACDAGGMAIWDIVSPPAAAVVEVQEGALTAVVAAHSGAAGCFQISLSEMGKHLGRYVGRG